MKKFLKFIGILLLLLILAIGGYYFANNEPLPEGKKGKKADALAIKMLNAINNDAFKKTEILEWSFRGKTHYRWIKRENIVVIELGGDKVHLFLNQPEKNMLFDKRGSIVKNPNPEIFKKAQDNFNNDSFWLIAPFKIFDSGTERRIVNYNGKDALLITYTSGGTTPGDSYLWILDDNYFPISFKMWTSIIPIGGVSATWSDWKSTKTGIKLPTKHKLSLFGMKLDMGEVKTENSKANILANNVLKAIKHEKYKKTRYLEWSFGGKRHFKWDKEKHIADISWDTISVNLHTRNKENSTVYFNNKKQKIVDSSIVEKAWDIFNNDSFWLVAPHKLFDDGTIRSIQKVDDKESLLVKYTTGGTTPGDSYLWVLDSNSIPKSFKMYVPSMKLNGISATWEDWKLTESGTLLPLKHTFPSGNTLNMGDVKAYN